MIKLKIVLILMIALCLVGCKKQQSSADVPHDETETPSVAVEATTEPTVDVPTLDDDTGFAGEVLVESTEADDGVDAETEPEKEPDQKPDKDSEKPTEPIETEPQETQEGNAIPDNTEDGDFLEPPAEGSAGVL